MQAAIENVQFVSVQNTVNTIDYLLKKVETADVNTKNEIENKIVSHGETVISDLVRNLPESKGIKRAVTAMSLIRIGKPALKYLREALMAEKSNSWVISYVIEEIQGSNESLAV